MHTAVSLTIFYPQQAQHVNLCITTENFSDPRGDALCQCTPSQAQTLAGSDIPTEEQSYLPSAWQDPTAARLIQRLKEGPRSIWVSPQGYLRSTPAARLPALRPQERASKFIT